MLPEKESDSAGEDWNSLLFSLLATQLLGGVVQKAGLPEAIYCVFPADSLVDCESPVLMRVWRSKFLLRENFPC